MLTVKLGNHEVVQKNNAFNTNGKSGRKTESTFGKEQF